MITNPLLDKDFLKILYEYHNKELFAKVIALTKDEEPIEEIQGNISSGGSISIDGTSTMRRTCSLTMVANEFNTNNYYWGLNTKFKLEIGLKVPEEIKNSYPQYPDIIWFPQGTYIFTSFSSSQSTNSYTISIQGKDKMCLLNGEVSGSLYASINFGVEDCVKDYYTKIDLNDKTDYVKNYYYLATNNYKIANIDYLIYEPNFYYTKENEIYTLCTDENFSVNKKYYCKEYQLATEDYDSSKEYYKLTSVTNKKHIPIKNIIKEAVHEYAQEPYSNIIINDLDDYGLELLEYRGDTERPLYMIISENGNDDTHEVVQMTLKGTTSCFITDNSGNYTVSTTLAEIEKYNPRITLDFSKSPIIEYTKIKLSQSDNAIYSVAKIEYGQTCGYRLTDITYAGDLISSIGESVTSILDKIVTMLGNFEYFYDTDGKFIFRKKQTYLDKSWDNIVTNEDELYADSSAYTSADVWSFRDSFLTSSFSNSPSLSNLKNDYALWGVRTSVTGKELPVHLRYAIDKKPTYYKNYAGEIYVVPNHESEIRQNIINELTDELKAQLKAFNLEHTLPGQLQAPEKQEDGSWSSGWWDIRDWYNYYKIIKKKEPRGTMKFYSYGNAENNDIYKGCVSTELLKTQLPGYNIGSISKDSYAWLIIVSENSKYVNLQHGSGNPNGFLTYEDYYESYLNNEIPDDYQNISGVNIRGPGYVTVGKSFLVAKNAARFRPPFNGCSASHTYLSFLKEDIERDGNDVYFYQPNFPNIESFADLIKEEIEEEYESKLHICDWREIIYQMALDYRKYQHDENFLLNIRKNNSYNPAGEWRYPKGYTGYEQYYVDLEGFWRQLYDGANWLPEVTSSPENINFWFDFLDTDGDINKYAVPTVGDRSKSVNDSTIKAIYFREVPTTILCENLNTIERKTGYTYMQYIKGMDGLFNISSQGKSAKNVLDDYLYKYAYCIESVSINAIPLYHLEPNTRIFVEDKNSGINGEYLINKITIPLSYNGTMSISATKAIDRIY